MPAVLFGSTSTIADTSEIERQAFNQAFRVHGLHWAWDRDDYRALLAVRGSRNRIARYAQTISQRVDADAVHRTTSQLFRSGLAESTLTPRPGVAETVGAARAHGFQVGCVTTASAENVSVLIAALSPHLLLRDFDVVVYAANVDRPKPGGAAYAYALDRLGEQPGDCVAVEDTLDGVRAAAAAGVPCVVLPNENTSGRHLATARAVLDRLSLDGLLGLVPAH